MSDKALVVQDRAVMPAISVADAVVSYKRVKALVHDLFEDGVHFGTIPGTAKPTLYLAGAQQVRSFFNVGTEFVVEEKVEDWAAEVPFFYYMIKCIASRDGQLVLEGLGSCNSREVRYAYRWRDPFDLGMTLESVQVLPPEQRKSTSSYLPAFALEKRQSKEENDKYGHPEAFYQMWDDAIASGRAIADNSRKNYKDEIMQGWRMTVLAVRSQNTETADLANTILKMAKKRAYVDAMLNVGALSEMFTQDIEDLGTFNEDIIEGTWENPISPVHGTSADYVVVDEAKNVPDNLPVKAQSTAVPVSELAKAREYVMKFGKYGPTGKEEALRNRPFGEIEDLSPGSSYMDWVIGNLDESSQDRVNARKAAQTIINAREQAQAADASSTIVELQNMVTQYVKDLWPDATTTGHVSGILKSKTVGQTKSLRDLSVEELEQVIETLRGVEARRLAPELTGPEAAAQVFGETDEGPPPGFIEADDAPF